MSYNPPDPEWQQNPGPQSGSWGNQQPQDGWVQPPQYGVPFAQQQGYGPQQYPEKSQAGLALGLGIGALISFCICGLFMPFLGGAAWYYGSAEKRAIANGLRNPAGLGQANTGMIMGIISVVLSLLGILAYAALILLGSTGSI